MKIAIVTGASSGMGREAVLQLSDRFSGLEEIWVIARRRERLEELTRSVSVPLRIFALDLSKPETYGELERALSSEKPDVKFLINSSGFGKIGTVSALTLQDQAGMISLNCQALCSITCMVLPHMSKNSRILQFASAAAFLPQPGFAVYAATKSFVLSFSRALHSELKNREICVTAVCPGPVKTEFFDLAEATGKIPFYKKLAMANSEKVVSKALRDSMMGKTISVYGCMMKAFFLLSKVLPHSLLLRILEQKP